MNVPHKQIASVVNYLWHDEKKNFEECFGDSVSCQKAQHHILDDLKIVRKWLEETAEQFIEKVPEKNYYPKSWKEFTARIVIDYCHEKETTIFTLQDLQRAKKPQIENFSKENKHPFDKIRQQLQFLRKDGLITFIDNKGTYSLLEGNHSILTSR